MSNDSPVRHADYTTKWIASGLLTTWWVGCRFCNCECYADITNPDYLAHEPKQVQEITILLQPNPW